MTSARLLRLLRIFYQGLRLITGALKKEINALEGELNEPVNQPKGMSDET